MTRTDLTVLLSGAALALAAGMLAGGAMQPHLARDDGRPAGPQMFAAWDGDSTGPFDPGASGAELAAYHGAPPDYVMGTDWKKAMSRTDEEIAEAPAHEAAAEAAPPPADPPPVIMHATYDEPPTPHDDPSMTGAHPSVIETPPPADATDDPANPGV